MAIGTRFKMSELEPLVARATVLLDGNETTSSLHRTDPVEHFTSEVSILPTAGSSECTSKSSPSLDMRETPRSRYSSDTTRAANLP